MASCPMRQQSCKYSGSMDWHGPSGMTYWDGGVIVLSYCLSARDDLLMNEQVVSFGGWEDNKINPTYFMHQYNCQQRN